MIGYVEAPKAWGLTRGMGRVLGVNLTDAVVDGWLTRGELAELVEALPAFCPNKAALESLSPR